MVNIILFVVCLGIGILLGYSYRSVIVLKRKLEEIRVKLEEKKPEPKSYVNLGAYSPPSETRQSSAVVNPISPQKAEFLANEKTRRENTIDRTLYPR